MYYVKYKVAGFGDGENTSEGYPTWQVAQDNATDIGGYEGVHSVCIVEVPDEPVQDLPEPA